MSSLHKVKEYITKATPMTRCIYLLMLKAPYLLSRYASDCWDTGGQSESLLASAPPSDLTRTLKVCLTDLTWPECCDWQAWPMRWDLIGCWKPTVLWPWTWTEWWLCGWRSPAWAPDLPSPATLLSTPLPSGGPVTQPGSIKTRNGTMRSTFTRWQTAYTRRQQNAQQLA